MDNNSDIWNSARISELIRVHEKHKLLYQPKHPDYFKRGLRLKAWKEISMKMRSTMSTVKQKWENVRHYFMKMLVRHELSKWNEAGDGHVYIPTWEHWDEMQYLRPFVNDRKLSFRNDIQFGVNDESSLVCEVDVEEGLELIDGNQIDLDEEIGDSNTADNGPPNINGQWLEWNHLDQRASSQLSDSSDSVQVEHDIPKSQTRGLKRKKTSGGAFFRESLVEKKSVPPVSVIKREPASAPSEDTASNCALHHFTSYVVETLKSLSKYQQDCAMVKIAQVLFEVQHSRDDLNEKPHVATTSTALGGGGGES